VQEVISTPAAPATSVAAARVALGAGASALLLLAVLHLLSPELDPAWRMVSEYALGSYAWVLALMFLAWATSCVALCFAIRAQIDTLAGKIGLGFLLAAALGMSMAAVFDARHPLHGLAALIGIPSLPIAALLISPSLLRNPAWRPMRSLLLGTAHLTWISFMLMNATVWIGLSRNGGKFGPGAPVGWPNRLLVLSYCAWLMAVAGSAGRLRAKTR
jgi:hypothetical protein